MISPSTPRLIACAIVLSVTTARAQSQQAAGGEDSPDEGSKSSDEQAGAANEKEQAISHFQAAVKLVEAGSYAEAARELERSIALYPSKNALFNLGNSYQALHRYVDALRIFERLDEEFGAELNPDLRQALDKQLAEVRELVVRIEVEALPEGASLLLDGRPLTTEGGGVTLDPGTYVVRAELDGYRAAEQSVDLSPGETKAVRLELEKAVAKVEIKISVDGATVRVDDEVMGTSPLEGPLLLAPGPHDLVVTRPGYHPYERSFEAGGDETIRLSIDLRSNRPPVVYDPPRLGAGFWVAAGATVVALGASATGFLVASAKDGKLKSGVSEYDDLPPNTSQVTLDLQYNDLISLQNQRNTFETVGWIGGGLAAAGAVTALAFGWNYFFAKPPPTGEVVGPKKGAGISLYPTATGLGGTF